MGSGRLRLLHPTPGYNKKVSGGALRLWTGSTSRCCDGVGKYGTDVRSSVGGVGAEVSVTKDIPFRTKLTGPSSGSVTAQNFRGTQQY